MKIDVTPELYDRIATAAKARGISKRRLLTEALGLGGPVGDDGRCVCVTAATHERLRAAAKERGVSMRRIVEQALKPVIGGGR